MQLNSFDAQVKYYTEYINQHENWDLVQIYADEGITGTNTKRRTGLKDMLRDCRNKKLDLIICKSISRMGRNTADLLKIVRETRELGVDIFFENENIHTLGSGGEFLITVFASLAQDTSRQISENVVLGQDKAMRNGTIFGNGSIMGYDLVDKKLIINEEQAKTVRRVFDLFLEGKGIRTIAKILEQEGHKTAKGKDKWNPVSIRAMLDNEKYCGHLLLGKSYTQDYLTHKTDMGYPLSHLKKAFQAPRASRKDRKCQYSPRIFQTPGAFFPLPLHILLYACARVFPLPLLLL
jgi:DNA invertase Pin-like site-specific DNA recombinase